MNGAVLTGLAAQRKAVYVMVLLVGLYSQSSSIHRALLNGLAAQRQAVYVLVPSSTNSYLHRVVMNSTQGRLGRQITPRRVLDQSQALLHGVLASSEPTQPRPSTINSWQTWRKQDKLKMVIVYSRTLSSSASLVICVT